MSGDWSCHALKLSSSKKLSIRPFLWCIVCFCTKSQIKSEWIYEIVNFQKMTWKIWRISALRVFTVHRAEIVQIFRVIFWKIDDFICPFWLNLTFSTETNDLSQERSDTQLIRAGKFEGVAWSGGCHAFLLIFYICREGFWLFAFYLYRRLF